MRHTILTQSIISYIGRITPIPFIIRQLHKYFEPRIGCCVDKYCGILAMALIESGGGNKPSNGKYFQRCCEVREYENCLDHEYKPDPESLASTMLQRRKSGTAPSRVEMLTLHVDSSASGLNVARRLIDGILRSLSSRQV